MSRKTLIGFVALVLVFVFAFAAVKPAMTEAPDNRVRVWVEFQPGGRGQVENALKGVGAEFHYGFDSLNAFVVSLPEAALNGIAHNPNVVSIEEDAVRYPMAEEVPYGVDMVQALDVWDANRDGSVDAGAPNGAGRMVCVIDSGLYTGHEDFAGVNVVGGYPANYATDTCGHGTHVAGTIAAASYNNLGVVGVTPGTTSLYIVKVFGDNCAWTYSSTLVDAANRCASAGANIISMSLGGATRSTLEDRAFNNLYSQGILSIAAAGNDGTTAVSYPAGYSSVVSVAAIDSAKMVADFSQKNSDVELAAPGVGVISTVPYLATNTLTVGNNVFSGYQVEYAKLGTASGQLVNGGLCDAAGAYGGKVVVCERGVISFYDKVMNVQNSGGVAAIIYNNVAGDLNATLGDGNSSNIPAIGLTQEDGQYIVGNLIGQTGNVESSIVWNVSQYEAYNGTSMATPHVSAVAALVWSANPAWTNVQIRNALTATAEDLGTAGRDVEYGYGLVQAKAALTYLGYNPGGGGTLSAAVATNKASYINRETVTITVTVKDQNNAAVSGATVAVKVTSANGKVANYTGTTGSNGVATFSYKVDSKKNGVGTYTILATATKTGYTDATATTTFVVTK